jgi:DNA-binding LytR/AlgR family response regulator
LQQIAEPVQEQPTRKVVGRSGDEYFLLNVNEVYAFQAEGELVRILTASKKYPATQTLRKLHERCKRRRRPADGSAESALVNMDQILRRSHSSEFVILANKNFPIDERVTARYQILASLTMARGE